jgi:hypothetical protein
MSLQPPAYSPLKSRSEVYPLLFCKLAAEYAPSSLFLKGAEMAKTKINKSKTKHCRCCGCTDKHACPGGCYWVTDDLCSRCASAKS